MSRGLTVVPIGVPAFLSEPDHAFRIGARWPLLLTCYRRVTDEEGRVFARRDRPLTAGEISETWCGGQLSARTVRRQLRELHELGYLEVTREEGRGILIRVAVAKVFLRERVHPVMKALLKDPRARKELEGVLARHRRRGRDDGGRFSPKLARGQMTFREVYDVIRAERDAPYEPDDPGRDADLPRAADRRAPPGDAGGARGAGPGGDRLAGWADRPHPRPGLLGDPRDHVPLRGPGGARADRERGAPPGRQVPPHHRAEDPDAPGGDGRGEEPRGPPRVVPEPEQGGARPGPPRDARR